MSKTILIVEDESHIRNIIIDFFNASGFHTLEAADGSQALDIFQENHVDLVILDIMLPKVDGWSVCKRIRKISSVPIILLTARSEDEDKLLGFELGADEYVTKPFSPHVMVARAKALLKRVDGMESSDSSLSIGGIRVLKDSFEAYVDGEKITLAPKEFNLLVYLIENKGLVLTRDMILQNIWGYDYYGGSRVVDSHIKKLRKKLGDRSNYINTIVRIGYKFEVPNEEQ